MARLQMTIPVFLAAPVCKPITAFDDAGHFVLCMSYCMYCVSTDFVCAVNTHVQYILYTCSVRSTDSATGMGRFVRLGNPSENKILPSVVACPYLYSYGDQLPRRL